MYEDRPHLPPDRRHAVTDGLPTTTRGFIGQVLADGLFMGVFSWVAGLIGLAVLAVVVAIFGG